MTEYIEKEALIRTVCEQYKGSMNTFLAKPNDFVQMVEDAPIADKETIKLWLEGDAYGGKG
jgi:hypothetical protein